MINFYDKRSPVKFTLNRWLHITIVLFFSENCTDKIRIGKVISYVINRLELVGQII